MCVSGGNAKRKKKKKRYREESLDSGNKWHLLAHGSPRGCFLEHALSNLDLQRSITSFSGSD